jgi:tRNA-Thr(GGU) m(6)t(6)A37 methyltransferase TsaA
MRIFYKPIGVIRTPFTKPEGMPIQSSAATGAQGRVEVLTEFAEGLKDLDGFSHIILLYHFHRSTHPRLTVTPFLDTRPRGVFATRAPSRPNPIGLSIVKLLAVSENMLQVENVDMLDATPLLDIKPYVPQFDHRDAQRIGWLEGVGDRNANRRADNRFTR